jgi:MinD superfamily P-loop ATPase
MKIAIASGKGGTGKTTLSTNLAAYLSEEMEVVLTDLDVEEPNSGLFLNGEIVNKEDKFKMIPEWIEDKCDACGICEKACKFNAVLQFGEFISVLPELCHSCYACSELCPKDALPMIPKKMGELTHQNLGNLAMIESRLVIGEEQAVPLIKQTNQYVKKYLSSAKVHLFDSPPGTSCPVIEATKDVDFVILITEPTPFGFHDLKLAVETMREMKKEFGVIINRYGIGNDDVINYCINNGIEIIAKFKNDRKVAELYSQGKLLYPHIPEFAKELEKIKEYIYDLIEEFE